MRKTICVTLALCLCLALAACGHQHTWQAASCISPKICPDCGETEGEALGHRWQEATCTDAKVCTVCLQTMGSPLGHSWAEATCTEAKTCILCGLSEGSAPGHSWEPADCTNPEICSACGEAQGEALGHAIEAWTTVTGATCTAAGVENGVCTVCGETVEQEIPMTDHTPSDWVITVQPTPDEEGTHIKNCTECGQELESENFTLSPEEIERLYKSKCKSISYDSLSRTPGEYEGEYVKFTGRVVQVCSEAKSALYYSTYRVATSSYSNVVYIYVDNYGSDSRILEDDWITFYGTFDGLYTYETVMGSTITIPSVKVEYVE